MALQITTTDVFGKIRQRPQLRGADARLRRVRRHMNDFDRAVQRFQDQLEFLRLAVVQFKGDESIYKKPMQMMGDAREDVEVAVGEIVQNLRSALDYLVFELSYLDSGLLQEGTQFPIVRSPDDFIQQRNRHLRGVNSAHRAAIAQLQPYPQRNWTLLVRELSNKDKHRRLHWIDGVVELDVPGLTTDGGADTRARQFFEALELKMNASVNFNPPFFVAFEDGQAVKAVKAVKATLDRLDAGVSRTLDMFRPCFEGLCVHPAPSEWERYVESLPLVRQ